MDELFLRTLKGLSKELSGVKYAVRGTASLVLQGFDFKAVDIDIITDKNGALEIGERLKKYVVNPVKYNETEQYKSYIGSFKIEDKEVEVYGDWFIKDKKGIWQGPFTASGCTKILFEGLEVPVTTADTELKTYALIGRWNVFHKLKKLLKAKEEGKQMGLDL